MRTPHEFKARPTTANLEELYTPQELDLPDPTTGKKVQTVSISIACRGLISVKSLILGRKKLNNSLKLTIITKRLKILKERSKLNFEFLFEFHAYSRSNFSHISSQFEVWYT